MFNTLVAKNYRNEGLSNAQIAMQMGVSYNTVKNHIGYQPMFMTKANRKIGIKQANERRMATMQYKSTMSKVAEIDKKIISLKAQRERLLAGA